MRLPMLAKTLLIAAGFALVSGSVFAAEKTVRLASEGGYPPFNGLAPNGQMEGFDIDIGNALCAEMKVKCVWVKQDWDGMIPALLARKYDAIIAAMSITAERKQKVAFTNKYASSPLGLVALKNSARRPNVETLKGKKLGVQRGTVSDHFATKFWEKSGVEIVRYAKQEEAYLDLTSTRVDAVLADSVEADGGFLKQETGKKYAFAGDLIYGNTKAEKDIIGEGLGIAIRKKDTALVAQFNSALKTIRDNGSYAKIEAKHFGYDVYGK